MEEEAVFGDLNFINEGADAVGPMSANSSDLLRQSETGDGGAGKDADDSSTDMQQDGGDEEMLSTELGKRMLAAGLTRQVASAFCEVVLRQGKVQESEIDARVLESTKHYPAAAAVAALNEFARCDVSAIENKFGYLFGIMRSWRLRMNAGISTDEQGETARRDVNDPQIAELLQRTGYKLEIGASQRRYGPPPNWTGEQPGRDCEVYVGRVPKECLEDELVPILERFGPVYDLRIMLDPATRDPKGFFFVSFQRPDAAKRCLEELNGTSVKPGTKPVKTGASCPNTRMYVGNVPKQKSREELRADLARFVQGVADVIVYPCADNPKKKNRGFCFVDFESHRHASAALKRLEKMANRIWHGSEIYVEWADPIDEVDSSALERVKTVFVNNISSDIDEATVRQRFEQFGKVQDLKRSKDYAFITFESREAALSAVENMNNTKLGKNEVGVQLARPLTDKAREMKQQRKKHRDRGHEHASDRRGDDSRYDYQRYPRAPYAAYPGAPYPPYAPWAAGGRPPMPMMPMPFMPVPVPFPGGHSFERERGRDRDRNRDRERGGSMNRSRSASATPRRQASTSFGGYPPMPPPGVGYPPPFGAMPPPYGMMPVPHSAAFAVPSMTHKLPRSSSAGGPNSRSNDRGVKRTAGTAKGGDATKRSRYDYEAAAAASYYGGGYGAGSGAAPSAAAAGGSSFMPFGFGYGAGGPGGRSFTDDNFTEDRF